jgi:hypothetical protein
MLGDFDPANYAGENIGEFTEYFPQDVGHDPFILGKVNNPEAYWPGPAFPKRRG